LSVQEDSVTAMSTAARTEVLHAFAAILALAPGNSTLSTRDRAILETLYSSSIRRLEAVQLEVTDVDTAEGTLMVRYGKGRRDRIVPLGARACRWIERYLERSRPMLARPESGRTLFPDELGRSLRPRVIEFGRREPAKAACLIP